jgi:hypothetical protein
MINLCKLLFESVDSRLPESFNGILAFEYAYNRMNIGEPLNIVTKIVDVPLDNSEVIRLIKNKNSYTLLIQLSKIYIFDQKPNISD